MCEKGFDDLLITCEIVGAVKVGRLVELWERYRRVKIVVDSVVGLRGVEEGISRSRSKSGGGGAEGKMKVLIDLDVGLHRTGVQGVEAALALANVIKECENLELVGIQGYEGHLQHVSSFAERRSKCLEAMRQLVSTADALRAAGHTIDVVTTGGTGTAEFCASVPGVTEVQPGSFLFMDTDYRAAIGSTYSNSLTILSTVLSVQGPRSVTIDAGLKSLTTDSGLAECKVPGYKYGVLGDEHGSLEWEEDDEGMVLKVGDRVEMVPSHIDPTVNLHDFYYACREGVVEEVWGVDARGKVQ